MTTDYRSKIEGIIDRYAGPGDDLCRSILDGAPAIIDWNEAVGIAHWLQDNAYAEWGYDPRHARIADEIIGLGE